MTTAGWNHYNDQQNTVNSTRHTYGKLKDIYINNPAVGNLNSHRGS
jgi:hypothetical protein